MTKQEIKPDEKESNDGCIWNEFTNQYSLSKTLRFELRPVGKTRENIKSKKNSDGLTLISEDEVRAKEYKNVKKIIDEYHKGFIEESLSQVKFEEKDLKDFYDVYKLLKSKRDQREANDLRKDLSKKQDRFRKQIGKQIRRVEGFDDLFGENLIKKVLLDWLDKQDDEGLEKINRIIWGEDWLDKQDDEGLEGGKELVRRFEKWTTYFRGFHENRKNVYSEEEIPTSIIYRVVHDNLPKFLDNVSKFESLKDKGASFGSIEKDLGEEFDGKKLEDVFSLRFFNDCLNQKGIERFNKIVGGKPDEVKIKGINEYVNEFSQKKSDKRIRSLKMASLFKQILSDRDSNSFVLEKFEDDEDMVEAINSFYDLLVDKRLFGEVKKLFEDLRDFSLEMIYVKNDRSITDISQFLYGEYDFIKRALESYARKELFPPKKGDPTKAEEKQVEDWIKKTTYFSINEINKALETHCNDEKVEKEKKSVCDYFAKFENKDGNVLDSVEEKYDEVKSVLKETYERGKRSLISREKDSEKIKAFLDSILSAFHFIKPVYVSSRKSENEKDQNADAFDKDDDFYIKFNGCFEVLEQAITLYNKCRNYVTQKPYSVEKFKLNFENSTLAGGWDLNKEADNTAVLFKKTVDGKELFYFRNYGQEQQ